MDNINMSLRQILNSWVFCTAQAVITGVFVDRLVLQSIALRTGRSVILLSSSKLGAVCVCESVLKILFLWEYALDFLGWIDHKNSICSTLRETVLHNLCVHSEEHSFLNPLSITLPKRTIREKFNTSICKIFCFTRSWSSWSWDGAVLVYSAGLLSVTKSLVNNFYNNR